MNYLQLDRFYKRWRIFRILQKDFMKKELIPTFFCNVGISSCLIFCFYLSNRLAPLVRITSWYQ